jgi:hypothetical protein
MRSMLTPLASQTNSLDLDHSCTSWKDGVTVVVDNLQSDHVAQLFLMYQSLRALNALGPADGFGSIHVITSVCVYNLDYLYTIYFTYTCFTIRVM